MKKEGRFYWVPAGIDNSLEGLGVYVKYKKYRNGPITLKRGDDRYLWIDCPDRELVIQRERHYVNDSHKIRSLKVEDYDEFVHLNVNSPSLGSDLQLPYAMVNAKVVQGIGNSWYKEDRKNRHTRVMVDSGGFQIAKQVTDFVDPNEVIHAHNHHGNMGMILDIPFSITENKDQMKRIARIQNKNTDVLMSKKRDDLELINIIHGMESKYYLPFRDMVERDDIDRVAFGLPKVSGVRLYGFKKAIELITTGRRYKHYHVLGVSDIAKCIPIMWLAKRTGTLITADSSSPVQYAVNGKMYLYNEVRTKIKTIEVSRSRTKANRLTTLPCSCHLCNIVKYSDIFGYVKSDLPGRVLLFHNVLEFKKYIWTIFSLVKEADNIQQLFEELKWILPVDRVEEVKVGLKMVDVGVDYGIKEVEKRFTYHLHFNDPDGGGLGLFKRKAQWANDHIKWRWHVIKKYEEYYGFNNS